MLTNPDDLAVLYGGAKGGGKDFLFVVWVKAWVDQLIQALQLKPSKTPLPLGWIGRKRAVDFKDTTLEEFKQVIPASHYRLADNEHEIIFQETAKVFCGGLDDPKRVEKFNSANLAFIALNQAEEAERNEVGVLRATLRLMVNGIKPPYKQLYSANPGDNWLKTDFVDADTRRPNHIFIPALYTDNPHLPANYRETLEEAFRHNEPLLRAYRDGDWTSLQATNALITGLMLEKLKGVYRHLKAVHRLTVCDPSLGGDECVIYTLENTRVIDEEIVHERDPMKIAGYMIAQAAKHRCLEYALDTTGGLGEAIAARIREQQPRANVQSLNYSEKRPLPEGVKRRAVDFANLRAEMWWYCMTEIQDLNVVYPQDEELRRQLVAVRFKVLDSNGTILLEPKADTKERLGCSPDRADAFVMGVYALQFTAPIEQTDAWDMSSTTRHEVYSGVSSAMTA